jgi:hypothetical protein
MHVKERKRERACFREGEKGGERERRESESANILINMCV